MAAPPLFQLGKKPEAETGMNLIHIFQIFKMEWIPGDNINLLFLYQKLVMRPAVVLTDKPKGKFSVTEFIVIAFTVISMNIKLDVRIKLVETADQKGKFASCKGSVGGNTQSPCYIGIGKTVKPVF